LVMAALLATGVRLVGVLLSGLKSAVQQSLFGEPTDLCSPCVEPAEPITPSTAEPAGWQYAAWTASCGGFICIHCFLGTLFLAGWYQGAEGWLLGGRVEGKVTD
jgi:hypothetical protein